MADARESELKIERTFDAPVEKVWRAWADGDQMKQWSCPKGFIATVAEGDFKVGGKYRFGMKSDFYEGVTTGEYKEIDEPHRLVFTHTWEDVASDPNFNTRVTVELTNEGDKTRMVFTQEGFHDPARRDSHSDGWSECFDKLSELLKST